MSSAQEYYRECAAALAAHNVPARRASAAMADHKEGWAADDVFAGLLPDAVIAAMLARRLELLALKIYV